MKAMGSHTGYGAKEIVEGRHIRKGDSGCMSVASLVPFNDEIAFLGARGLKLYSKVVEI